MTIEFATAMGAWAALAALVYWLGYCWRDAPGRVGALVKAASTACLAVIVAGAAFGPVPALWPIALGLALGSLGDWCLAQRGKTAFLAGMAAFGTGHLAYAGAMLARAAYLGFDGLDRAESAALVLLAGLVGSTELWLAPRTGALRGPVRAYVAMIGLMGLVLILLPRPWDADVLRLGGVLFILSDLLLALRLFVVTDQPRQRALSLVLWPAYWSGQALICLGALAYWSAKV